MHNEWDTPNEYLQYVQALYIQQEGRTDADVHKLQFKSIDLLSRFILYSFYQ